MSLLNGQVTGGSFTGVNHDATLSGTGLPGSPLSVVGGIDAEHGPDKFRAIGDGTTHIINATINPDTGLNWTQAEADAYWYGCKTKYQINDIQITSAVAAYVYTVNIGGTPYSYTAGIGESANYICFQLASAINLGGAGSSNQNATVQVDFIRVVLGSAQTVTVSAANMANTLVESFGVSTIDVTTDTVDYAAIQHAFSLMQSIPLSYCVFGNGKRYRVSRGSELPHFIFAPYKIVIDGKGCEVKSISGTGMKVFSRVCPSSGAAVWLGFTTFHIQDFLIGGNSNTDDTGIYLEAAHGSILENIIVGSVDVGFDTRFNLKIRLMNCDVAGAAVDCYRSWNAEYFGSTLANAGNNLCHWINCEAFVATGSFAGFHNRGSDCCKMDTCVVEGGSPVYGTYWDNDGSTVAKNFEILNCHMEMQGPCDRAVIGARSDGGSNSHIRITNVFNQGPGVFLELDSGPGLLATVRDMPYATATPLYRAINEGYCRFHFENAHGVNTIITGSTTFDPNTWLTDGTLDPSYWDNGFGGAVPPISNVRNITYIG